MEIIVGVMSVAAIWWTARNRTGRTSAEIRSDAEDPQQRTWWPDGENHG